MNSHFSQMLRRNKSARNHKRDRQSQNSSKKKGLMDFYKHDDKESFDLPSMDHEEFEKYKQKIQIQLRKERRRNLFIYLVILFGLALLFALIFYS